MDPENKHLWDRFCKLGEMIGDGLHHESDGKWISKEYKQLSRILIPEVKEREKELRKIKTADLAEKMKILLTNKKCSCGGELKQKRLGTLVAYCVLCNSRYIAKYKK